MPEIDDGKKSIHPSTQKCADWTPAVLHGIIIIARLIADHVSLYGIANIQRKSIQDSKL